MKIEERERLGLAQFREKGDRRWRFMVSSFSGPQAGKGVAHMVTPDGTLRPVPISGKGYLTIAGRRYGPRTWDH